MPKEQMILVVDDESQYIRLCAAYLGNILSASNAIDAIELLAEQKITHLIVDGLNGAWSSVVESARIAGVEHIVLISGNQNVLDQAVAEGIPNVSKKDLGGAIGYRDLLKIAEGLIGEESELELDVEPHEVFVGGKGYVLCVREGTKGNEYFFILKEANLPQDARYAVLPDAYVVDTSKGFPVLKVK